MLRAIQPRAVRLYRIEEQDVMRAILVGVCHYRNLITRLERVPFPSLTDHDADARSLDIPSSYRRAVGRVCSDDDDDMTVRVLPPVLLHDASIRNILSHIEHRARMMSESRTGCRQHEADRGHRDRNCPIHPLFIPFERPMGQRMPAIAMETQLIRPVVGAFRPGPIRGPQASFRNSRDLDSGDHFPRRRRSL